MSENCSNSSLWVWQTPGRPIGSRLRQDDLLTLSDLFFVPRFGEENEGALFQDCASCEVRNDTTNFPPNVHGIHHSCLSWIQEGFKGGGSAETPKPDSGSFSGRFGSDSGGLPHCNSDFGPVTPTLACNSDFRAETRIISLKICPQIMSRGCCSKAFLNPDNSCQVFDGSICHLCSFWSWRAPTNQNRSSQHHLTVWACFIMYSLDMPMRRSFYITTSSWSVQTYNPPIYYSHSQTGFRSWKTVLLLQTFPEIQQFWRVRFPVPVLFLCHPEFLLGSAPAGALANGGALAKVPESAWGNWCPRERSLECSISPRAPQFLRAPEAFPRALPEVPHVATLWLADRIANLVHFQDS